MLNANYEPILLYYPQIKQTIKSASTLLHLSTVLCSLHLQKAEVYYLHIIRAFDYNCYL